MSKDNRKPFCPRCFGRGIFRNKKTSRWERCYCGRLLRCTEELKLQKQADLDARLEELKVKGW
jgi:hypothetical protein